MTKEIPKHMDDINALYVLDGVVDTIKKNITKQFQIPNLEINVIEAPITTGFDYGVNVIKLAKILKKDPTKLSEQLARNIEGAEVVGPFLNFKLNMSEFGHKVVNQILEMKSDYGKENEGNGQKVVIDMSSPNIAKRMSYGHLRSTIIGDALANLHRSAGYEVIRDNHIGDWGTQFGKLIVAIKNWGNEQELLTSDDPIGVLQDLYVKFHSEEEIEKSILREEAKQKIEMDGVKSIIGLQETIETISQEIITRKKIARTELDMTKITEDALDRVIVTSLEKEGRNWFLKLEKGNKEARRLWKLCIDLSLKEFNQIYEVLGVNFEESFGESFYEGMLTDVINKVSSSKAGHISNGALVIDMEDKKLGVAIVQKSDGASVYMTRDLACAIYREEEMKADKAIYVVGDDQKQYFEQLFEALRRLGYKIGENSVHVYFGMVSLPEGKMSTRKGRVILLKDVLNEGFKKAKDVIETKSPELNKNEPLKNEIVRQVAVGALKWNDLCQDPRKSIIFNWDKALNFDGNSAPYVQYTAVRANSIIETSEIDITSLLKNKVNSKKDYQEASEKALIRQLANFPSAIKDGLDNNSPAKIASYVFELAKRFNSFYGKNRVLGIDDENIASSRLKLVAATSQTIKNSLAILGIEVPLKM